MKRITPDLKDPQNADNKRFANLLDLQSLNTFLKLVADPNEKRSLDELFYELLLGRL